jgi:hypothetical protein
MMDTFKALIMTCDNVTKKSFIKDIEQRLLDIRDFPFDVIKSQLCSIFEHSHKGSSMNHENGFIKLGLYKSENTGVQIRLHIWPEGHQDSTKHNHRWDFISLCLKGDLTCVNYQYEPLQTGLYLNKLSDASENNLKNSKLLDRVKAIDCDRYKISEGQIHWQPYEIIHQVLSVRKSLTLFISSPEMSDHSLVITDKPLKPETRKLMSKEQCMKILEDL